MTKKVNQITKFFIMVFAVVFLLGCIPYQGNLQSQGAVIQKVSLSSGVNVKANTNSSLNPKLLGLARKAQDKVRQSGKKVKDPLVVIDYSLPSTQKRLWVVDEKDNVLFHTFVAHGRGSGDNVATKFSDIPGSTQTSLGVFVTGKTYQGRHGHSLELHGLEKGYNANAYKRRIVVHAADYVSEDFARKMGRLGRSFGCPALENQLAKPIIEHIKEGAVMLAYYPDKGWLAHSAYTS